VASQLAVDTVAGFFDRAPLERPGSRDAADVLVAAMKAANERVFRLGADDNDRMGTTLVAALFIEGKVAIAHVGDSRCYRIRGDEATCLTADHSYVEEMRRKEPAISAADLEAFAAYRHLVTRAIGMHPEVEVDVRVETVEPGDVFILCSDGIWGSVSDAFLADLIHREPDLEENCRRLIATANQAGGHDNGTVVLVRAQP
jgi:PPM family protein phosphatase